VIGRHRYPHYSRHQSVFDPLGSEEMQKRKNSESKRGLSVLTTNATLEDTDDAHACALRASRMAEEEAVIYAIKGLFRLASNRDLTIHPLHVECFKRVSKIFTQLISSIDSTKWSGETRYAMKYASCCRVVKVNYEKPNVDVENAVRCVACGTAESTEQYAIDFGGPYDQPFVLSNTSPVCDMQEFLSIRTRFDQFIDKYMKTMEDMETNNFNDKGRYHVGCYCMHHMTLSWTLRRHFDTLYYNMRVELDAKSNESALKDAWYLTRLAATTKSTIHLIEHARNVISSRSYIQKSAFPIDVDKTYWYRFQMMRQSAVNQLKRQHGIKLSIPIYSHALALVSNSTSDDETQLHTTQLQQKISTKVLNLLTTTIEYDNVSVHNESESDSDDETSNTDDEQHRESDSDKEDDKDEEADLSDFIDDETPTKKPSQKRKRILDDSDDDDNHDNASPANQSEPISELSDEELVTSEPVWENATLSLDNFNLLVSFLNSKLVSTWSSEYASTFYEIVMQRAFTPEQRTMYLNKMERLMNQLATHIGGGDGVPMESSMRRTIVHMKKEMVNKLQSDDVPDCFQEASCVDKLIYRAGDLFEVTIDLSSTGVITTLNECTDLIKHTVLMLVQCDWTLQFEQVSNDMYRSQFSTLLTHLLNVCEGSWPETLNNTLHPLTNAYNEFYNTHREANGETHTRIHKVATTAKGHLQSILTFMHGVLHFAERV
jgi:hypothetical protein